MQSSLVTSSHLNQGNLAKLTQGISPNKDIGRSGAGLSRGPYLGNKLGNANLASANFPIFGSALDLDFENDRTFLKGYGVSKTALPYGLNFTRGSGKNYIGSNGLLQNSPSGTLTLDYQNQITPNLTNCLSNTENYSTLWQSLTGATFTGTNGKKLTEDSTTGQHGASFNFSGSIGYVRASNLWWTTSFNAKADGRSLLNISNNYGSFIGNIILNVSTGAVTQNTSGALVTSVLQADGSYNFTITLYDAQGGYGGININLVSSGTTTSYPGTSGLGIYFQNLQLDIGKVANPYQPMGPYTALPAVVPVQVSGINQGFLSESAATNYLLWCRDATKSQWIKTGITPALDQTGIDGVANSASSLLATTANAIVSQQITLASSAQAVSAYLKPIFVTGQISISQDGVNYWPVTLTYGIYNRVTLSQTMANSGLYIKIQNSGDSVAMDYGQIEAGVFSSSPIFTNGSTSTRSADLLSPVSGWSNFLTQNKGTWFAKAFMGHGGNQPYVGQGNLSQPFLNISKSSGGAPVFATNPNYSSFNSQSYPGGGATGPSYSMIGSVATSGISFNNTIGLRGFLGFLPTNLSRANDNVPSSNQYAPQYGNFPASTVFIGGNGNNINERIKRIVYIPKFLDQDAFQNFQPL